MTDVRRLNHLFAILAKMQSESDKSVWEEFKRQYTPTEQEQGKLKALYNVYFTNDGGRYEKVGRGTGRN